MSAHEALLIFPNQLYRTALSVPKDTKVVLVEAPAFFFAPNVTKAELVTYRAALQALRERFLVKGYEVTYLEARQIRTSAALVSELASLGLKKLSTYSMDAKEEEIKLQRLMLSQKVSLTVLAGQAYLVTEDVQAGELPPQSYSKFAAWLRQKLQILVDPTGSPLGGSWQLPQAPKRKYKLEITLPERNRYVVEAAKYVAKTFPRVRGGVAGVSSPVTFADAEDQLEYVLEGDWQASPEHICERYIMPSVALGLLPPSSVVTRIMQQNVPVATQEAFLRPLLRREWRRARNES
jgi:deoxyribodipyrimidine photolyase-related protein